MNKKIFIVVMALLLLTTVGVSAQQFVQSITLQSGEMVQIVCEGDEPEFLVNIKGNSNYTRCISVAPSPTITPTVEPSPTSLPGATETPTSPVTPLPSVTVPVTVNVAILEASSGSAMLNANNWSSVQTGVVNEAGEYSNCRFVGATDGLRVYCQFWTPVVAGDSAKIFINNVPIELNWPTTNGWEIAERCSAVDCRGWTAFKRFDWDVFGGKPADGVLWPLKVDYKNYTWDGVLRWGFPNYNGTPGFVKTDVLADAASIGGGTDCADDDVLDGYFPTWGSLNRGLYGQQPTVLSTIPWLNTQMQWDVADWPCYSAGLVKWGIPADITLENLEKASLSLYRFGHPGYAPGDTETTTVEASIVSPDWDRNTVVWNTAPKSLENIARVAVTECLTGCDDWFTLDVTEAVNRALQNGQREAAVRIWTNAGNYHSGKYFYNSGGVNGPLVTFETGSFPTPTPVPPTATPVPPTPTTSPPTPATTPAMIDNFDRENGPVGNGWGGSSIAAFSILSNTLSAQASAPFPIVWTGKQFSFAQEASVKIVKMPASGEVGLILKADAAAPTSAINVAYQVGANSTVIFLKNGGWNDGVRVNATFSEGDVMGARAFGDGAIQILRNGVVVATTNITSWPFNNQGGYTGIYVWNGPGAVLDDFDAKDSGGVVPPAPTITPTLPTVTPMPTPTVISGSSKTFYVGVAGTDANSGLSTAAPFASFAKAWSVMKPGDTLLIMDGYYTEVIRPTVEGVQGKPITIRALNDGKVTIDAQYKTFALQLGDTWPGPIDSWFVVEGIVFRNGSESAIKVNGENNVLRRVSAYNASTDLNSSVVAVVGSKNILLEDMLIAGTARKELLIFGSQDVVARRVYTKWTRWDGKSFCAAGWPAGNGVNFYSSDNILGENLIAEGPMADAAFGFTNQADPYAENPDVAYGLKLYGSIAINAGMNEDGTVHVYPWVKEGNTCNPNSAPAQPRELKYFGVRIGFRSLGQGPIIAEWKDVYSYGAAQLCFGIVRPYGTGTINSTADRITCNNNAKDPEGMHIAELKSPGVGKQLALDSGVTVTNSFSPIDGLYGEGARLTHRYVNGVLTDIPLWPWPMDGRAVAELGFNITERMRPHFEFKPSSTSTPTPVSPTPTPVSRTPTPAP